MIVSSGRKIRGLIVGLIVAICISVFSMMCLYGIPEYPSCVMDSEWSLEYGDVTASDISLHEAVNLIGGNVKRGDVIRLSTVLPKMGVLPLPTMQIYTRFCAFRVYVGGKQISEGFQEEYATHRAMGSCYSFITLPVDYSERIITVELTAGKNKPFNYLEAPILGNYNDVRFMLLFKLMFPMLISVFIMVFGGAFLIISLLFYPSMHEIKSQLFSSLFSLTVGMWMICYFKIGSLLSRIDHITDVEFTALFILIPVSFLLFGSIEKVYYKAIYNVMTAIAWVVVAVLIGLHYAGIVFMYESLLIVHGLGLILIFIILYCFARDVRAGKLRGSDRLLMYGFVALGITLFLSIVFYQLKRIPFLAALSPDRYFIPMGTIVNTYCILINYYTYVSESFARKREYASLAHLAYADPLTDIANRSRSDKYMQDLDKSKDAYCIISMDINGLKTVNDTLGHHEGDRYLKEFANAMQEARAYNTFCARIGGDEFLVISNVTDDDRIQAYIQRLRDILDEMNERDKTYFRSFAAGYACREAGQSTSSHDIYMLADTRMYAQKRQMHKELGIGERR